MFNSIKTERLKEFSGIMVDLTIVGYKRVRNSFIYARLKIYKKQCLC